MWSNCLAGWWLSGGGLRLNLLHVSIWITFLYLGGMYLNDAFDAGFDRNHRSTRPIPSGVITEKEVCMWGCAWMILGLVGLVSMGGVTSVLAFFLAACILFYNAIHKIMVLAPVIMGGCRLLVYLAAASVGFNGVTGESVWKGLALGTYIVGLSCRARKESAPVRVQYWPGILLAAPVIVAWLVDNGTDKRRGSPVFSRIYPLDWLDIAANRWAGASQYRSGRLPTAGGHCAGGFAGGGGFVASFRSGFHGLVFACAITATNHSGHLNGDNRLTWAVAKYLTLALALSTFCSIVSMRFGRKNINMKTKMKSWSRKKIRDKFAGLTKADGTPMSRQQIHMMRKKAHGICLTCGAPAIGVYCLKHTIAARERMRQKLKYRRRLRNSSSYVLEKEVRSKRRHAGGRVSRQCAVLDKTCGTVAGQRLSQTALTVGSVSKGKKPRHQQQAQKAAPAADGHRL